jgi:cobalt/nickel transport system permease protein
MHIPDGFLDPVTAGGSALLAGAAVATAHYRLKSTLHERLVPLLGVTAAGVFAAQMVNFPIPGGTSGHLLGGVLTSTLVGPWAGLLAMTCVLIVQCLMFGDGGLLALGANILNMAVVGCLLGHCIYAPLRKWIGGNRGTLTGAVVAAWLAAVFGAMTCSWELALAGNHAVGPTVQLMVSVHSLIGIGEALLTGLVVVSLLRVRPEIFEPPSTHAGYRTMQVFAGGLAVALVTAVFASPWASKLPDGLDYAAERLGFACRRAEPPFPVAMPEYQFPGVSPQVATSLAGLVGVLAVLAIALALGRSLQIRQKALSSGAMT